MIKTIFTSFLGVMCVYITMACSVLANQEQRPLLHDLFKNHMVLQRDKENTIWGWSTPDTSISINIAGFSTSVLTDKNGKWTAKINPLKAGGPYELTVNGTKSKTITDILIGDIWLCSGQSNMGMAVNQVANAALEIEQANYPEMRLFTVPRLIAATPSQHFNGNVQWKNVTPKTIGSFSAACYFMARKLHKELGVPIGLINSSWGGTTAESWTTINGIEELNDFKSNLSKLMAYIANPKKADLELQEMTQTWWQENDLGSRAEDPWSAPSHSDESWTIATLPTSFSKIGLSGVNAVVWFRKTFTIENKTGLKKSQLALGRIITRDAVWINGVSLKKQLTPIYDIPKDVLKIGKNIIAIRASYIAATGPDVINPPKGGFRAKRKNFRLLTAGHAPRNLSGEWKYKISRKFKDNRVALPKKPFGEIQQQVSVLYNGMIAPLMPLSIKGVAWYQGEANTGRPKQYEKLLPIMIKEWRRNFAQEFPFLIVQISSFNDKRNRDWPALREAQHKITKADPLSELAVTIDIGNAKNIHPENKQDVGKRLALAALHLAYDKDIVYSGPVYKSHKLTGSKLYLNFDHIGSGLKAGDTGKVKGFTICVPDEKCTIAQAQIHHDKIVVTLPETVKHTELRYAWGSAPINDLHNQEGLPAVPFRLNLKP